jgi:mRNA interferase MazF
MVSRGDVWLVLAADGSPSAEPHPCVILSPPEIHDYLGVVTIAPIGQGNSRAAYRVPMTLSGQPAVIHLDQIKTVEKHALTRQTGTVERKTLAAALAALREMFAE